METRFYDDTLTSALEFDSSPETHPVVQTVTDPAQINELFDSISYDKGASLIRFLQGLLGEETFLKGLQSYLLAHSFSNAQSSDLWEAMAAAWIEDDPDKAKERDLVDRESFSCLRFRKFMKFFLNLKNIFHFFHSLSR